MNTFKKIFKLIKKYNTIVIARHIGADPDALGSTLGLKEIILNTFKNKSALSSQIAEKRKELGFDDEKSYNSTIVHNSRRVKEYLNKKAIIGEDGKEIIWMRFFYGKNKKVLNLN